MNTNDIARLTLTEATLLAIDIDSAMRRLDQARAGYPSSTPGASTPAANTHAGALDQLILDDLDPDQYGHLSTTRTTPVESRAGHYDEATTDIAALRTAVIAAEKYTRIAKDIAHKWAIVRIDDTTVTTRLATIDAIWCTNCAQHGFSNPRREGGAVCDYCAGFKSDHAQYRCYPPKRILEIWTTRGKVSPTDVHRIMRELKASAKQAKREQNPDWRNQPDPARRLTSDPSTVATRRARRLTA